MMGQTIKAGTGMSELILDEEKLFESLQSIGLTQEDFLEVTDTNIDSLLKEEDDDELYCSNEHFSFSV